MSALKWFAKIQSPSDVRFIASGRIVGGSVANTKRAVIETLEARGVDGRRFREIFRQKEPITINGFEPTSDFQTLERRYQDLVGQVVTLTLRINGKLLQFKNATVVNFVPARRFGKLTGYGETSDPFTLGFSVTIECPNTEPE